MDTTSLVEHLGFGGLVLALFLKEYMSWARTRNGNGAIQARLTALEVRMEKQEAREIPPAWFEREVRETSQAVKRLMQSCVAVQRQPRDDTD